MTGSDAAGSDRLARLLLGGAALAWLGAMALPATTRGVGSALAGHELADLAGSGLLEKSAGVPRWLGPAWYLMPLGGAIVLASSALRGTVARLIRAGAAAAATASATIFTVLITDLDVSRIDWGSWCALGGSTLAAASAAVAFAHRSHRPEDHDVL